MPGLIKSGALGTVSVQVGDKFGNPVQPGTALYFGTLGGLIQASSTTDNVGQSSSTIYGGNPAPNEPSLGGRTWIHNCSDCRRRRNIDSEEDPIPLLRATCVITAASNILIPDSGTVTFQYHVQDVNGNPLVAGTTIALTVDGPGSGQLELSGDVNKTLLDSADPSTTIFTVTARERFSMDLQVRSRSI